MLRSGRPLLTLALGLLLATECLLAQAPRSQCRHAKFTGHAEGGKPFGKPLGSNLEFVLWPMSDDGGWEIRVEPHGLAQDWAYVVTPPLRFGNSQVLYTAYGQTVREQLSRTHEINFVLDQASFDRMTKLADDALWPYMAKDQEHAPANYLGAVQTIPMGLLVLKPTDYDKLGPSDQAHWMNFEVTVTVPASFHATEDLNWTDGCPPPPKLPRDSDTANRKSP